MVEGLPPFGEPEFLTVSVSFPWEVHGDTGYFLPVGTKGSKGAVFRIQDQKGRFNWAFGIYDKDMNEIIPPQSVFKMWAEKARPAEVVLKHASINLVVEMLGNLPF